MEEFFHFFFVELCNPPFSFLFTPC